MRCCWFRHSPAAPLGGSSQESGYRSVAAHKLIELDEKYNIFGGAGRSANRGSSVQEGTATAGTRATSGHQQSSFVSVAVDLAAAPGGFAQVAVERMLAADVSDPTVIAFDLQSIRPLSHVVSHRCSINNTARVRSLVRQTLQATAIGGSSPVGRWPLVVLHDGVSTGDGQRRDLSVTYAQNNMALCALKIAVDLFVSAPHEPHQVGRPGRGPPADRAKKACFVTKAMHSVHFNHVLDATRRFFDHVDAWKPPSSRPESREMYIVAKGLKSNAKKDFRNLRLVDMRTSLSLRTPFSLHPRDDDLRQGRPQQQVGTRHQLPGCGSSTHVVWMCHHCEQMRSGCYPCSQCSCSRLSGGINVKVGGAGGILW